MLHRKLTDFPVGLHQPITITGGTETQSAPMRTQETRGLLKAPPTDGLTSSAGAGTATETAGLTATVRGLRLTWTNIIRLITISRYHVQSRFMRRFTVLKTERWITTHAHLFRLRALIRANGQNHLICAQAQSLWKCAIRKTACWLRASDLKPRAFKTPIP